MQCRTKIKNKNKNYKKVKDSNNKTGEDRKSCKFYDKLDQILRQVDTSSETTNSQEDIDNKG